MRSGSISAPTPPPWAGWTAWSSPPGVGENGATNRAAICEGLEFLGVKIDPERNNTRGQEALISTDDSKVKVWVIPTNEELMIAQDTADLVKAAQ